METLRTDFEDGRPRCGWVGNDDIYIAYHDEEWGTPLRDDRALFELLILEGAQAGLSWITVLKRREGYRRAFDGFDIEGIAAYGDAEKARLLADPGIIRNRAKVDATIGNARAYLAMQEAGESFGEFLWSFVGGEPKVNHWPSMAEMPAETDESKAMSKALLKRGFRFVGPTICYAFMQATGMVDDHADGCWRRVPPVS